MASDILHIKDSYYFEVPRALWRSNRQSAKEFGDSVGGWVVRNDPQFQEWESDRYVSGIREILGNDRDLLQPEVAQQAWREWANARDVRHGRPFDQYVIDSLESVRVQAEAWAARDPQGQAARDKVDAYLAQHPDPQLEWMRRLETDASKWSQFQALRESMDSQQTLNEFYATPAAQWSEATVRDYNSALSGKIFIPQPFGQLRNAYEVQSGFGISRYMVIEVIVAILLLLAFRWLAGRVSTGTAPRGKMWNFLEGFVTFIRNNIVVPAMGEHDADKYMPFFWTLFLFILGCNLMGMIPWVGAPTSVLATTGTLALLVFLVGLVSGVRKFGVLGYLKNLSPHLGLPIYLGIVIVPLVWAIEVLSLFIKHGVLAVRLLANMVAGHLVLLGFMGIAFSLEAAHLQTGTWTMAAIISIVASTLLSFLELFVAFLQAYIFTFLAALFIGNAIHHH
jgi:F-type H+-transporting ATPase subunit a